MWDNNAGSRYAVKLLVDGGTVVCTPPVSDMVELDTPRGDDLCSLTPYPSQFLWDWKQRMHRGLQPSVEFKNMQTLLRTYLELIALDLSCSAGFSSATERLHASCEGLPAGFTASFRLTFGQDPFRTCLGQLVHHCQVFKHRDSMELSSLSMKKGTS